MHSHPNSGSTASGLQQHISVSQEISTIWGLKIMTVMGWPSSHSDLSLCQALGVARCHLMSALGNAISLPVLATLVKDLAAATGYSDMV